MNSAKGVFFTATATTRGMPNTRRRVSITTDRMLEEPCEATSLMHGFEAERRGRPLRLGNHLDVLKQGKDAWNQWRKEHVDLTEVDLSKAILFGANLSGAILTGADLGDANLSRTNLSKAILNKARLVNTNLEKADLTGCSIYGISAWNVNLEDAIQENLIITLPTEPVITVDDLEIAQFIYLLLNNKKIRNVIDTITSKVVLILGRFTPERKKVLNALRDELRKKNYLPIIFDFEKPASRDVTETMSILAHLARFVIADI